MDGVKYRWYSLTCVSWADFLVAHCGIRCHVAKPRCYLQRHHKLMNHLTEHLESSSNKDLTSVSIKCEAFLWYWSWRSWAGVLVMLVVSLMLDACPHTPMWFLGMWKSWQLCFWDCVTMSEERRMGESS